MRPRGPQQQHSTHAPCVLAFAAKMQEPRRSPPPRPSARSSIIQSGNLKIVCAARPSLTAHCAQSRDHDGVQRYAAYRTVNTAACRVANTLRSPVYPRRARHPAHRSARRLRLTQRVAHVPEEEVELLKPLLRPPGHPLLLLFHQRRVLVAHAVRDDARALPARRANEGDDLCVGARRRSVGAR